MPSNNHRNCLLYLRLGDAIEQIKTKIDWKMWGLRLGDAIEQIKTKIDWKMWGSLLLMVSLLLMWVLKKNAIYYLFSS
jgi:hypothetical protein